MNQNKQSIDVPGKTKILSLAGGLLLGSYGPATLAQTAGWDCRPTAATGWECAGDGQETLVDPLRSGTAGVLIAGAAAPAQKPAAPPPATAAVAAAPSTPQSGPPSPATPPDTGLPRAAPTAAPGPGTKSAPLPSAAGATPVEPARPRSEPPRPTAALTRGAHRALLYRDSDVSVCAPRPLIAGAAAPEPEDRLIHMSADAAEYFADAEAVRLSGAVEISQPPQRVLADEVIYDSRTGEIEARGSVFYERPELRVESAGGSMSLETYRGRLQDIEYRLPQEGGRGVAQSMEVEGKQSSRLTGVSYTTCAPGYEGWSLDAGEIELHHNLGLGEARDAKLRLGGVPILYLPYLAFPVGVQRQSGLLPPSVGYSDSAGVSIATPYYFNLAPSYDATLTPRMTSERGPMLGGEFRFLTEQQQGTLQGEILPDDWEADEGGTRGALSLDSSGLFAERWTTDVDVNYVSDSDYLEDLGNSLAITSQRQLERRGDLVYHGDDWYFLTRVQGFQTIDEEILEEDRPYSRLPQTLFSLERPLPTQVPVTAQLDTEYVYFSKDDSVQGHRVDLYPAFSLDLSRPWGYLRPKVGVRHTLYSLDGEPAGASSDPQRTLPVASLDGGLIFERGLQVKGHPFTQTLEPRLFYLYVPQRTQDELPLFDTSERDLTFDALFEENRFNGTDRIGDANQISVGLLSRTLQGADGTERLRLGVGQIYYFEDLDVQLPDTPAESDGSSPIVASALGRLDSRWTLGGDLQWDPDDQRTESAGARIQYRDDEGRILNLAHRVRRDLAEHSDISARWPLGPRTHLVARWDYSWLHDRTIEAFGGIEYDSCCWVIRAVARNWTTDLEQGDSNLGVYVQLELKGLASLGSSVDDLLQRGILGYGKDY